jgi:hypothetical protein
MSQDVSEFVRACDLCFRTKTSRSSQQGSLQPLSVPFRAWSDASPDYITPLPECERHEQRYKHILVLVCRLTKMRLSIPTVTLTAEDLAIVFLGKVYVLHGTPERTPWCPRQHHPIKDHRSPYVDGFVRSCDLYFRPFPCLVPDISMDYITALPEYERHGQTYTHILIVVCLVTKMRYPIQLPLRQPRNSSLSS